MKTSSDEAQFTDFIPRSGLRRSADRMASQEATTVAFLGGSVTAGEGASDEGSTCYRALTCRYLQERFPRTPFTFVNAAIGGTDSVYGAFRLTEHVFGQNHVDLLFVEFAVNDNGLRTQSVRAMEGIVRQARRINPGIDICFIYTANQQAAEEYAVIGKPQANVAHHEEVAAHYQIPSIHIVNRIYKLVAAGSLRWKELSEDSVHPNDYGYSLYASCIKDTLEEILQPNFIGTAPVSQEPPMLDLFCYQQARLLAPVTAEDVSGWRMAYGWRQEPFMNWTPPADVYWADEAGASFRIRFAGTSAGLALLAGMETGDLDYSVDEQPFQTAAVFDKYCSKFYRPKIVLLADALSNGSHTLDVRISRQRHEHSKGNCLHITNFMVNGTAAPFS